MLDTIERQLAHTPSVETRNRKPLRPNDLARWEPRIGGFRAFYDVIEPEQRVRVLAIGHKYRDRLLIAGKEYKL